MSDEPISGPINRRNVLQGITASIGAGVTAGVAAGDDQPANESRVPSEEERAELRAPFADFEKARSVIVENTEGLRAELARRGYLPSAKPAALRMNHLETGTRKAPVEREIGFDDVRVKTAKTEEYGTIVAVDTLVRHRNYVVTLNYATNTGVASALVVADGEIEAFLRTSDSGTQEAETASIEDVGTTAVYECTNEVCDDCCGTFDCSKEYKIIYDPDNSRQVFCECVTSTTYCCESGGCGTLCMC